MKSHYTAHRKQQGVALIFALLLLLVMTIIGVTAMSNVTMQERMAGNVNIQALAFEAASAGIARSLEYGLETDNWPEGQTTCRIGDHWGGDWTGFETFASYNNITARYRLRVYCRADAAFAEALGVNLTEVPPQLFVRSEGQVVNGAGETLLSTREIEVRVENRGSDPDCGFRLQGDLDSVDMPESNRFKVDGGEGGCPMSTSTDQAADDINDDLEIGNSSRVGNYQPNPPGIEASDGKAPWNDPEQLAQLMNVIKAGLQPQPNPDDPDGDPLPPTCVGELFIEGVRAKAGPGNEQCGGGTYPNQVNTVSDLTYVAGDFVMGGNTSGSGMLIVEGEVCWNGTAEFEGMVVALGGLFQMKGGGQGDTAGFIYITNLLNKYFGQDPPDLPGPAYDPPESFFGASSLDLAGGGNHTVTTSCGLVNDRIDVLNSCLDGEPIPYMDCAEDGIGKRRAIASWRENIGWPAPLFE